MEDRRRQRRVRPAFGQDRGEITGMAGAARRDHRDLDRVGDGLGERQVVASLRAIGVDAGQQDLAGTAPFSLPGPTNRVEVGGLPTAVGVNPPVRLGHLLGIDGDHDALRSVEAGAFGDQPLPLYRRGLDGHFVRART